MKSSRKKKILFRDQVKLDLESYDNETKDIGTIQTESQPASSSSAFDKVKSTLYSIGIYGASAAKAVAVTMGYDKTPNRGEIKKMLSEALKKAQTEKKDDYLYQVYFEQYASITYTLSEHSRLDKIMQKTMHAIANDLIRTNLVHLTPYEQFCLEFKSRIKAVYNKTRARRWLLGRLFNIGEQLASLEVTSYLKLLSHENIDIGETTRKSLYPDLNADIDNDELEIKLSNALLLVKDELEIKFSGIPKSKISLYAMSASEEALSKLDDKKIVINKHLSDIVHNTVTSLFKTIEKPSYADDQKQDSSQPHEREPVPLSSASSSTASTSAVHSLTDKKNNRKLSSSALITSHGSLTPLSSQASDQPHTKKQKRDHHNEEMISDIPDNAHNQSTLPPPLALHRQKSNSSSPPTQVESEDTVKSVFTV